MGTVGIFDVIYEAIDSSGNKATMTLKIDNVDTTNPVIEGLNDFTLEVGSTLPDLLDGVSATDLYDGDISLTIDNIDVSNVDINTVGTYNVIYTVEDLNGNVAFETIIVTVEDTSIPELTLIGDSEITIVLGEEYTDLGGIALDNYDVNDSSGNTAVQVTRVVHVISDISLLIVDPNLEQAIRNVLGKQTGEITIEDCESITELSTGSITDLLGLEYLINLTGLFIFGNQISDISPIANNYH